MGMGSETGTDATREFYDTDGWARTADGNTVDGDLFGVKEDGPIRVALFEALQDRISKTLSDAGHGLKLIECGCGGAPEQRILPHCSDYTGVDFSEKGLSLAEQSFATAPIPTRFQQADICALPFDDGAYDAVYSAHVIYHIEDAAAQKRALAEMVRVTRDGGALVIIAANPHPVLFPMRAAMRLVTKLPALAKLLRKLRGPSPIPYNPQSIGWMRDALSGCSQVDVVTAGIPSTWFNQNVTEYRYPGKALWQAVGWLERTRPGASAHLGNYVVYLCRK